jgi:predicted ABC-type ATPase
MKKSTAQPRVIIFAGPNGAGKSTHAEAILAQLGIATFVNADYIARGLAGRDASSVGIAAGRIMLTRLRELAGAGQDFAFESTLSSRSFAPFLRSLKAQGYRVAIHYFSLPTAALAVRRVRLRVASGGHDVPAEDIKRRFGRSIQNFFQLYQPLTDDWVVYDNHKGPIARIVADFDGQQEKVYDQKSWQKLKQI